MRSGRPVGAAGQRGDGPVTTGATSSRRGANTAASSTGNLGFRVAWPSHTGWTHTKG